MLTTKVFAKAGLDNVTSATCKHQQRFGLDFQFSALVLQQHIFKWAFIPREVHGHINYPFH